jgi:hypothetical protein
MKELITNESMRIVTWSRKLIAMGYIEAEISIYPLKISTHTQSPQCGQPVGQPTIRKWCGLLMIMP